VNVWEIISYVLIILYAWNGKAATKLQIDSLMQGYEQGEGLCSCDCS